MKNSSTQHSSQLDPDYKKESDVKEVKPESVPTVDVNDISTVSENSLDIDSIDAAFFRRSKFCVFCALKDEDLSYKNPSLLSCLISDSGKILPSRITNICASHSRKAKRHIKRARDLGLIVHSLYID